MLIVDESLVCGKCFSPWCGEDIYQGPDLVLHTVFTVQDVVYEEVDLRAFVTFLEGLAQISRLGQKSSSSSVSSSSQKS